MVREPKPSELEKLTDLAHAHAEDAGLTDHDQFDRKHSREQLKRAMISPDYTVLVYEKDGVFIGYAMGAANTKLWNNTIYGEMILFFVHPNERKRSVADELFYAMQDWFLEVGCVFMQASCMGYDKDYMPNEAWLNRARNYFTTSGMQEVGYHFVKNLEDLRWEA